MLPPTDIPHAMNPFKVQMLLQGISSCKGLIAVVKSVGLTPSIEPDTPVWACPRLHVEVGGEYMGLYPVTPACRWTFRAGIFPLAPRPGHLLETPFTHFAPSFLCYSEELA